MVTTRHASYSPEKIDSPAALSPVARTSKRGADDNVKASPAGKRRKTEAPSKPTEIATQPKQSTRIRFGSEEADLAALPKEPEPEELDIQDSEEEAEDEDDSDDEAPEDISASAAQRNAEASAAAAQLAVEKQRAEDRRKRQEHAVKLAKQAQDKKIAPASKVVATTHDDQEEEDEEPDLLPEELLATEFVRPPTPPPAESMVVQPSLSNRVVKLSDDAPRDRKVGPVTVSVLQKTNKLLPPKASAASRDLREKWLAGKRKGSGKGDYVVPRKAFGGGFVKR